MQRFLIARGIALQDGKLLCVQNMHPGAGVDSFWCLPGGKVEDGESLIRALQREMVEELGIQPDIGELLYVHRFSRNDFERVEFFFFVRNAADYNFIDLAKASHGSAEIAQATFIDPRASMILPEFLQTEDLQAVIATGKTIFAEEL